MSSDSWFEAERPGKVIETAKPTGARALDSKVDWRAFDAEVESCALTSEANRTAENNRCALAVFMPTEERLKKKPT